METTYISDTDDLVKALSLGKPVPILPEFVDWKPADNPNLYYFGSLRVKDELCEGTMYSDYSILVQHKGLWHVLRPEGLDAEEDEDREFRVFLAEYVPLPQALIEAGGWPAISKAMGTDLAAWVMHKRGFGYILLAAIIL